jgi:hypothetical protein
MSNDLLWLKIFMIYLPHPQNGSVQLPFLSVYTVTSAFPFYFSTVTNTVVSCITVPCLQFTQFIIPLEVSFCCMYNSFSSLLCYFRDAGFFSYYSKYISQSFLLMCTTQFFFTSSFIVFTSKIFCVSAIPSFRCSVIISHVQHIATTSFQKASKTSLWSLREGVRILL